MYNKIAITNRRLCSDLLEQIKKLDNSDYSHIILREKDLTLDEYIALAKKAVEISPKMILHYYADSCKILNYKKIHVPFYILKKEIKKLSNFDVIGVSIHSIDEALEAETLGASYITASHIFETKCKEGLEPKGLKWLNEVCNNVNIPVYALGGINEKNAQSCIDNGAFGVCMMSEAMRKC